MDCSVARTRIFQSLDAELSADEQLQLDAHMGLCASCAGDMKLLWIPRKLSRVAPLLEPSPFFYQKLRARLERESQSISVWQIVLGLSRQVVPALATLTLAILTVFAYVQLRGPQVDVYQAYDMIFTRPDRPYRMVIADQDDITDESVLRAMAEEEPPKGAPNHAGETPAKKWPGRRDVP